ncbi:hypothetical protein ACFYU5_10105 [Nocardia aobensis]|uniref:MarR family transcriptional regulator n=1 Tax=Nocardia aobensis TaxID=257277 RepID=A0ABW6P069_9NOCA|nr:hypothetical protein [Nocardia cerradoensis]NKY42078.1 hypothetical protein [Nocardia cerradoensis]
MADAMVGLPMKPKMNRSDSVVLSLLAPGGLLTTGQIRRDAALAGWRVRVALTRLSTCGFVVFSSSRARWQISERGRRALEERQS